ncbi:MAG: TolC family protein [Saprospiraceae bacterium]|nr:TolC family protein [Saprospiraceae bacterium]
MHRFVFLFILLSFSASSQTLLLDEAIEQALLNNFNIRISQNEAVIDKTNNTLGNAGFLPRVTLNFGQNLNINNTRQELFNGDIRNGNNVNTDNLSANVQLAWTLFDGMRMFVNRERLKEIEALGQLNVQLQVENTIFQVMSLFYTIDQQKKRIETIRQAILISGERLSLAQLKKDVGTGSGIPVLQAEVDINADSAMLIRQNLVLTQIKIQLNEIMGRSPDTQYDIVETLPQLYSEYGMIDFADLQSNAEKRSLIMQMAGKNLKLTELNKRQWESNKYPSVDFNAGYNYSRLNAEIGILKFNQNAGIGLGLTGRWNIFSGYNNKREIQVAKLSMETARLAQEQSALTLNTDLFTMYKNFVTAREMVRMENNNIKIARKNLDITTEKMRLGTIDALELRQAQLNLVDAEFRKITADFEANMSMLEMKRLTGVLVN